MRHIDLGGLSVFALTDCAPAPAPCGYSFPDAVLSDHPGAAVWFPDGAFRTRFGPFLLRGGDGDILVDCGMGPETAYFPGLSGTLPDELARAGSSLAQVKTVIFTHLHVDHVGWAPHLPHARFHVAAREWAHWSQGESAGLPHHTEAVARCIAPLAEAGRLHLARSGAEILPGLVLLEAAGHTPGHHAVLAGNCLLIAGDIWHNPAQLAAPAWCHRADMDKPRAIATRTRIAQTAHRNAWLIAAGHFVEYAAFGRVTAASGAYAFSPTP